MSYNSNKACVLLASVVTLVCAIGISAQSVPPTMPMARSSSETSAPVTFKPDTTHSDLYGPRKPHSVHQKTLSVDEWQFHATPYIWLPSLHGTGGIGNRTSVVDESFGDLFRALDFVFTGSFEAHKGKFTSLSDMEYVDVSDNKATPGPLFSSVQANFKNFFFDTEAGYRILSKADRAAYVDVLAGARIWHVNLDLDFGSGILPATKVTGSRNWVDAVGGMRGRTAVSKSQKVFVTGKFDLGGGCSKFTYQVFGAGGYNVNDRIAVIFGYRLLNVNYSKNNFIYDITQRGPIVGLDFRF